MLIPYHFMLSLRLPSRDIDIDTINSKRINKNKENINAYVISSSERIITD